MTFKEIYDDLIDGVPFKRMRGSSLVTVIVVDACGIMVLAYHMNGATYQSLGIQDLTATDWERA